MFLLLLELIVVPGTCVSAVGALCAFGYAVWRSADLWGERGLAISLTAVLVAVIATVLICLRRRTWEKLSLRNNIDSHTQPRPDELNIPVGAEGETVTRLAPMGKVSVGGREIEAKSTEGLIGPRERVTVTGFENFNILVRRSSGNGTVEQDTQKSDK